MDSSQGILQVFTWNNHEVEVDEDGFIQQPELWNDQLALALARSDGVTELTDAHWKIINYIRSYFQEFEIAPMIRKLCKETGFSLREIYDLFPSGPAKGACKVAGLPKPTGCV
jgi:tRNA 2-thiouridine synthesizing protein E